MNGTMDIGVFSFVQVMHALLKAWWLFKSYGLVIMIDWREGGVSFLFGRAESAADNKLIEITLFGIALKNFSVHGYLNLTFILFEHRLAHKSWENVEHVLILDIP